MPYRTPSNPVLKFFVIACFCLLLGALGLIVVAFILIATGVINPLGGFTW